MKFWVIICKTLLVTVAFVPLACGEGGGCNSIFRSDKGGVPVVVEKVKVRETSPVVTVTGRLVPRDRADISYPYDVKVQEVFVNVGKVVIEGDQLFRISEDEITNDLTVAGARKIELEALVEKNTNILRSRERMLEEGKVDQQEITRLEKEIALNEAELKRVQAEIVKLNYNLEHSVINSPISGIVTKRNISSGSVARSGEVLISIIDVNPIVVSFSLDAKQVSIVEVDTPLEVYIDEVLNKTYTAKVTYISPELHRAGKTFDVWAAIPNDDFLLKAGMNASTELGTDTTNYTFIVPYSAVQSKGQRPYVYTVSLGVAHKTYVTVGRVAAGSQAEIVRGLTAGDIVVVKGAEDLFDGVDVNIWR